MKKHLAIFAVPLFISIGIGTGSAFADDHSNRLFIDRDSDTFAVLPDGVRFPEGITANPDNGDIYVGTFDAPPGNHPNKLLRYDRHGKLIGQLDFGNTPLLGLEFDRAHKKVYILNVGNFAGVDSKIQRVAANLTQLEDVAIIPGIGAPAPRTVGNPDGSADTIMFGSGARVPNAMVFDKAGNLYVSDSFQGAIFKVANVAGCSKPCSVETFSHDPQLATPGFPPFGANGLAFNKDESVLFIANTGDDRVLSLDMGMRAVTVLAESLNGADGLVFDKDSGLLWVCTNQADEVVALNANGKIVAKLGEFRGINRNGTPDGILFPASPVIVGDDMFVTNLAIALTPAVGDEPEEDVTRWTISRLRLPH
ncbi:MAG TPA: SMP-30/gluconolactonase/LRE family protein [Burkholderiales bacterium]|nr:SMP-30/gluconolactonase/LRE family protein [Burkholderiales bacterium]